MLKTHIILLVTAVVISIASVALYKGFGLSTADRLRLNAYINANPLQLSQSMQLLALTQPLETYLESTRRFEIPVPSIVECKQILDASIPTLITESNALSAQLATVNIPSPTAQLNTLQQMLDLLPLYTGRVTEIQRGNCSLLTANREAVGGEEKEVFLEYAVERVLLFASGAGEQEGIYYIRVFSNNNYLTILNDTEATIEFVNWNPPLGLYGVNGTAAALFQQQSIAVAPGGPNGVRFTLREYISSERIVFRDLVHNLTAGSIVQVVSDLEMQIEVK
jgi:hypothetical protein